MWTVARGDDPLLRAQGAIRAQHWPMSSGPLRLVFVLPVTGVTVSQALRQVPAVQEFPVRWSHCLVTLLWMVNGIIFYVVLFATDQWLRIVPTTWDVFPSAVSTAVQYLSNIGVALIFLSSWLGDQMVHIHGVDVEGRE